MIPADRLPIVDGDIARVQLSKGQAAIIDAVDAERIGTRRWFAAWSPQTNSFYAAGRNGRDTTLLMHRFIVSAAVGTDIDHANHDTLDNRRSNLRLATRLDNNRNRLGLRVDNISGYAGVSYFKQTGQWRARVSVEGARHSLGLFDNALDAALARDQFIRDNCPSEFWTFNVPLLPGERGIITERKSA